MEEQTMSVSDFMENTIVSLVNYNRAPIMEWDTLEIENRTVYAFGIRDGQDMVIQVFVGPAETDRPEESMYEGVVFARSNPDQENDPGTTVLLGRKFYAHATPEAAKAAHELYVYTLFARLAHVFLSRGIEDTFIPQEEAAPAPVSFLES